MGGAGLVKIPQHGNCIIEAKTIDHLKWASSPRGITLMCGRFNESAETDAMMQRWPYHCSKDHRTITGLRTVLTTRRRKGKHIPIARHFSHGASTLDRALL